MVAFLLLLAGVAGAWRLKRFVDEDPRLCAQCHRASPEFSLWAKGTHRGVACQRCHHSTPQQGLAMLRSFLAGHEPGGKGKHAEVSIGSCASCHLPHGGVVRYFLASGKSERMSLCQFCHAK